MLGRQLCKIRRPCSFTCIRVLIDRVGEYRKILSYLWRATEYGGEQGIHVDGCGRNKSAARNLRCTRQRSRSSLCIACFPSPKIFGVTFKSSTHRDHNLDTLALPRRPSLHIYDRGCKACALPHYTPTATTDPPPTWPPSKPPRMRWRQCSRRAVL